MELLGHWWNGTWSPMSRRNIHLYRLDDGRYLIEWSGDSGRLDGSCWRSDPAHAVNVVAKMIADDGGTDWREITTQTQGLVSGTSPTGEPAAG